MDMKDRESHSDPADSGIESGWLFRSLADNVDQGVFVVDAAGCCVAVNDACCRWLRQTRGELVGRAVASFWPLAKDERYVEDQRRVLNGERIDKEEQVWREGRTHRLRIREVPLRDDEGGVRGVVCLFVELSAEPEVFALSPSRRGQTRTVLAVDPDVGVLRVLTHILAPFGFEVRAVRDGRQAVRFYREHQTEIDVALVELQLPGQSGLEALRELRGINPRLPVVLASGGGETEPAGEETNPKVGFVTKPFEPVNLARCLWDTLSEAQREEG
jgi:PAS domain S-box-containing protein